MNHLTPARIGLARAGDSIGTKDLLAFQAAHALARDAVHEKLDLTLDLSLHSAAPDRATFLRRPDLGRALTQPSRDALRAYPGPYDLAIVVADGLSALAVHRHAQPVLEELLALLDSAQWTRAPLMTVEQGRVAIADEIGSLVHASLSLILIGERPGLSSPDSLGAYLTWHPQPGRSDAERNCISNIRTEGLAYAPAALRIFAILTHARARSLTGFELKEGSPDKILNE